MGRKAVSLAVAIVGLMACTVESRRTSEPETNVVAQAAWYDEFETTQEGVPPETPRSYAIPRHTTCTELGFANAAVTVLAGSPPRDAERGCAELLIKVEFDGGEEATADFRTPGAEFGQCASFSWTSSVGVTALVVNGHWQSGSENAHVQRFNAPRASGEGMALPELVDGSGNIDGIELCYNAETSGEPTSDAGSVGNDDAGDNPDGGSSGGNEGDGGGGKTW
jgi:hypothetical protein